MRSHPFYGRTARDTDREADVLAQLTAALIVENHAHHLHVQARRARIHQTTRWWRPWPQAAIDPHQRP
jgi:hypothetical protein